MRTVREIGLSCHSAGTTATPTCKGPARYGPRSSIAALRTTKAICEEMPRVAPCHETSQLYTHDGSDVLRVVRSLPDNAHCVVMVGHNPALEEAVDRLTGSWVELPTSAVAVVRLGQWGDAGTTPGTLETHGRPPGGP